MSLTNPPKALLTDVFGTVVDWRGTVTEFLSKTAADTLNDSSASIPSAVRTAAAATDWAEFAWQWRLGYYHFTRSYDPSSGTPFKNVDQHFCESLISLLERFGLTGLWTDEEIKKNSMIWHFLHPWKDSPGGLGALNEKFATCTLSNGNTTLLSDLAEYGKLPYTHILSAEDFKAYKPHPNVYNGAAKKLGLQTTECAMVAAHLNDLQAAKGCGYQTIYIERKQEEQWDDAKVEQAKKEGWVGMWVGIDEGGFEEVAKRFGCKSVKAGDVNQSKLEENAQKGVYHETGSITGLDKNKSGTQGNNASYHEDPSITK